MPSDIYQLFNEAVKAFAIPFKSKLAIGVSGGSDSMTLLCCFAKWAKQNDVDLIALTVNHNLRNEAKEETKKVAIWAKNLGIKHHILTWDGIKPTSNIQEQARKARFDLMLSFCQNNNIKYLALAHHLEDQAETFLIRLQRGSGVDGLGAITPLKTITNINIIRPLLNISCCDFKSFLESHNLSWIDDPSNNNDDYQRVKFRKIMPLLTAQGLTADVLAKTAKQMQRARVFLDNYTNQTLAENTISYQAGYIEAKPDVFIKNDDEIALRALKKIIMQVAGLEYPLRLEKLSRLAAALKDVNNFKGATLSGCQIIKIKTNEGFLYQFVREFKKVAPLQTITKSGLFYWDNRFFINISYNDSKKLFLKPLGKKHWKELVKDSKNKLKTNIPRLAGICLPALCDEKDVLLVPHLGYKKEELFCDIKINIDFIK